MQCPRCLNTNPKYFYLGSKGWYCRKCISFSRILIEEELNPVSLNEIEDKSEEYQLTYPLTPKQKQLSVQIQSHMFHEDILLEAVCGAGKTEIMVEPIAKCLREKKKVCFAIARRQVVLELADRFQNYFPNAKVVGVCGGHTEELDGDLIIATCHQLYRYSKVFDILVLDEPDAFPYKLDPVLHGIARTSCKGHIIYLTATPDEYLKGRIEEKTIYHLSLLERPHHHPLPVPEIHTGPYFLQFFRLLKWLEKHKKHPRMVFVPTIHEAKVLFSILQLFMRCSYVTSQSENRDEIIRKFKKKRHGILICTTVMERGITISRVDICVFHADHSVFDEAGLIQMAGRAGRNFRHPTGNVLFLCIEKSTLVKACQKNILEANASCIA